MPVFQLWGVYCEVDFSIVVVGTPHLHKHSTNNINVSMVDGVQQCLKGHRSQERRGHTGNIGYLII